MKKVIRIGTVKAGCPEKNYDAFAKVEYEYGKLSISGVIGPRKSGNAAGSSGQFIMDFREYDERGHMSVADVIPAPGWNAESIRKFFDVWDKWHLNDMRAGCVHQRKWDTSKKIEITEYGRSDKFYKQSQQAKAGELSVGEYTIFSGVASRVNAVVIGQGEKWESPEVTLLLGHGLIRVGKSEIKTAGWVNETEHPEGLLCKPCPECGYKYGTAWLKEEVPADVIAFLESLPETDKQPAWV